MVTSWDSPAIYDRIRIYIYIVDGASFVLFKYFFRGRQIAFFLVLGRLPLALSCAPWRVLAALAQQLRDSRSAEPFVPKGLADLSHRTTDHLQAQALHLRWAGHCSGRERATFIAHCWWVMWVVEAMSNFNGEKWGFPKMRVPQNGWFIVEIPIKMDDFGGPPFMETPKWWLRMDVSEYVQKTDSKIPMV